MSDVHSEILNVKKNISYNYIKKRNAILALCTQYGGLALQRFQQQQQTGQGNPGKFWKNQTGAASDGVFSKTISEKDFVGFFLYHTMEYGVYLELANNRKHAALAKTVGAFYSRFERDLEAILK